jgi:hypothetical protein
MTRHGTRARICSVLSIAGVCIACLGLSGCYDDKYIARRDFITPGAGDAQAINAATQTIDPWPPEVKNNTIDVNGRRLGLAVQRYQENRSIPPKGLNTTNVTEQASPNGQVDTSIQK